MKTLKNLNLTVFRVWLLITLSFLGVMMTPASRAGLTGPYTNDFYTLHLWHLQDTNGTVQYVGTNSVFQFDYATNPLVVPLLLSNMPGVNGNGGTTGGATNSEFTLAGQAGPGTGPSFAFTNYGYALSIMTTQYSCYYAPLIDSANIYPDPSYTYTNNSCSFVNTNTGAFTWEALVQPGFNPLLVNTVPDQLILGSDGPNNGVSPYTTRAAQFRIDAGQPSSGKAELEFINISCLVNATNEDMTALLPTTGPDAVVKGLWYHVAVAYTGNAPTNGDPAHTLTLYWTLFDPTRTNADVLANFPYAFCLTNLAVTPHIYTNTYPYPSNSIVGTSVFGIGGIARNAPGKTAGGAGFEGNIAEVRISDYYRHPNEFMFNTSPTIVPISITGPSPTNYLVGYGQTLNVSTLVGGSAPYTLQWFQNGQPLAGQTNAALVISNVTFAVNGNYEFFGTNAYGNTNSLVSTVTVGAKFDGLFNTGCGPQNNPLDQTAPGSVDLHWQLPVDPDPTGVIPNAIVWKDGVPLQPNGVAPPNGASVWIAEDENPNGNGTAGTYTYQTTFQVDEAVVDSNAVLSGSVDALAANGGSTMQMFLNGVETDITLPANPAESVASFTITNGLLPGSNTLACTAFQTGSGTAGENAFNLAVTADTGNALSTAPAITNQPASTTNLYGSTVSIASVALGAPPLYYQWFSNGVAITPQTWVDTAVPYLSFSSTNFSPSELVGTNFFADYQIVFSNFLGVATSSVATVDVQLPPLSLVSAGVPIWNAVGSETNIIVYFSTSVDPGTATTVGNYSLNNGASVLSAAMGGASNEVVLTTTVLNPATSYTLTVQNVQSSLFGLPMAPSPASIVVGTFPNVAFWFKGNAGVTTDGSGDVTEWDDQSGNGNNLVGPFGPPFDPLIGTNAGLPVVDFIATNETILQTNDSPTIAQTNDLTIFTVINFGTLAGGTNGEIVSKCTGRFPSPYDYYCNGSSVMLLRGNGTSVSSIASTKAPSTNSTHILDVVMKGWSVTHRLDGQANGGGNMTPIAIADDPSQPLNLGTRADAGNRLTGGMNELILIGSALSSSDVASMETFLAAKYNLTIPPVNTNPTNIVFSVTNNQMTLSWPTDHTGWQLQAQTNSVSVGISTNWVNINGSTTTNEVVIPITLTNGSVFYRLIYP